MATEAKRNPPFRAEHLGSLLRPDELLEKRDAFDKGELSAEELKKVEDEAIKSIVQTQLDLGYRAISDGEFRRHMFWGTFFPNLDGMEEIKNPSFDMFRVYVPDMAPFYEEMDHPPESVICVGKIKHTGQSTYIDQFEYLKTLIPEERWGDIKLTLAAPEWYHLRYKEGKAYPKDVYANDEEYFHDIALAYQTELDILYKAGLRNVQIDDPNFAYFCSQKMIDGWSADPSNTTPLPTLLTSYIALYNACLARAPADMHLGLHICRGNFINSRHFSEGGYDAIASQLFKELNVHTFYLEYDTPRAGTFEPLREVPRGKNVVLGVVTSKFPEMEERGEMVARVRRAAETMAGGAGVGGEGVKEALHRLGVSPQCGFASHRGGNCLGKGDMVAKLRLVREIAEEVWPGEP
ncbi:5-methyltetrahydropteroyltriglutamate-homocysteine methyltransferase [Patellaria atrata CBS 101060]|uniref:5-methyltetrahydropteroyltriglutamate-homocysteine methyltransferase n=1 Tax=Patellaria atrata CBS 101060 TaxID=1346257 RepID=A0A9P4S903_9PEZI|nr:5-methyltetrahydropteroyltriglutamate-homocysteine methyltransferase [Patellaria atrata CBS 101060]